MARDTGGSEDAQDGQLNASWNRRSILKGLGASGLGMFGIQPVSGGRPNATVEIDQVKTKGADGQEKVIATREVPRAWYTQMKRARRVNKRLQDRFLSMDGVFSVGVTALGDRIAGKPKHGVRIRLEGNSISASIPRRAGGVPVIVERNASKGVAQSHNTCNTETEPHHYNQTYDPLLAGAITEPDADSLLVDDCTFGTICCRVNQNSSSDYILTARHIWGCENTDNEIEGMDVYQHSDKIGTISDAFKEHDAVVVDLSSSRSASLGVVDDPNGYSLFGYVTKNEMGWLLGTEVQTRGVKTGAVTATPTDYEVMTNLCDGWVDQVEYSRSDSGDGDSGGPYFYYAGHGDYHLLGMHSWANLTPPGYTTKGVAGYALANQHSIWPAF